MRAALCSNTDDLAGEWEDLAQRVGASPFLHPGWVRAWARHFASSPLEVLTVRRGQRLVALLPLLRRWGSIRSPTNFHSPEFAPLAEDPGAAGLLFDRLFAWGLVPYPSGAMDYVKYPVTLSGKRFSDATGFRPLFGLEEIFHSVRR